MRAEEGEECSAGEGVDDEERARGRAAVVQWSCAVAAFEFFECIGERASVSKVLGAAFVGVVFAASADGELEEECDEGRDDGEEDQFKDIAAVFVAAAESGSNLFAFAISFSPFPLPLPKIRFPSFFLKPYRTLILRNALVVCLAGQVRYFVSLPDFE